MKFTLATLVVALAANGVVASNWLGTKAAYNKWHETELERWLSDHNVPYPTPADRKDLENLVKDNWNAYVVSPYQSWQTPDLQSYLTQKGRQVQKGTEQNKDSLIAQVKAVWSDTEDSVATAYGSTKDWILDSWTESQLKAFLDKHGIPNPQPRTRDSLLKVARENYQTIANKAGDKAPSLYPGNWLYETWSESDLKEWLDTHGFPAPQPTSRDKLIASVRRNARIASNRAADASAAASASAAAASNYLSDQLLDAWSDSQIKEWLDKKGIKVPQGSKRNELQALARKNREKLYQSGSSVSSAASSYYGAATSSAGNQYARATDDAQLKGQQMYGAFGYYLDLAKKQLGLAQASGSSAYSSLSGAASASASSASSVVSASASSLSDAAASSASSASSVASKSSSSLSGAAAASASSASSLASKSSSSASSRASASASKASKSASSAASAASKSAKQEL